MRTVLSRLLLEPSGHSLLDFSLRNQFAFRVLRGTLADEIVAQLTAKPVISPTMPMNYYHITLREVVDLQRPRHGPSVSRARTATLRAGAKSN